MWFCSSAFGILVGFCIGFEFNHLKNLLLINIHTIKMQIWRTGVLLIKMMMSGRKNRAEWEVEGPERWRSTWALWKGGGGRGEGRAWLYVESATLREEKKERGWLTIYDAITELPEAHVYKDEGGGWTRGEALLIGNFPAQSLYDTTNFISNLWWVNLTVCMTLGLWITGLFHLHQQLLIQKEEPKPLDGTNDTIAIPLQHKLVIFSPI